MSSLNEEGAWPAAAAAPPAAGAARLLAAALLAAASRSLAHVAASLMPAAPRAPGEPRREFHAEAGAPEGALYVDGELVGMLRGVRRL